jgi:hypothetical protein
MAKPARTVSYVMQYKGAGPGDWIDVNRRETPEDAFERLDMFRASWDALSDQEGRPQGFQVVRREIIDTVIEDPRPAPEEAEAVSG